MGDDALKRTHVAACFSLALAALLSPTGLHAVDLPRAKALGTDVSDDPASHSVLARPDDHPLSFPGFLVGVEKARLKPIGAPTSPNVGITGFYFKEMLWWQRERMFVSHLVEFVRKPGADVFLPRPIYSAYSEADLTEPTDAFEVGRRKLVEDFRAKIDSAVKERNPTHLILFTTGWNTSQVETIKGMEKLKASICGAVGPGEEFRPLIVGISWPSMSERLGDLLEKTTYQVKSSDADEVGMLWASTLVGQVLAPIRDAAGQGDPKRRPRLVVIGHSFGARVATWTAFTSGLGSEPAGPVHPPDIIIGLQGAFSLRRFVEGEGVEGAPIRAEMGRPRSLTPAPSTTLRSASSDSSTRHSPGGRRPSASRPTTRIPSSVTPSREFHGSGRSNRRSRRGRRRR